MNPKPPTGDTCNHCGLCCLAETCPAGVAYFPPSQVCSALQFDPEKQHYLCGLMIAPFELIAPHQEPEIWRIDQEIKGFAAGYFRQLIGAQKGCDSED